MEFKSIAECPYIDGSCPVKYIEMGNVIEVQYMSHANSRQTVRMLPDNKYTLIETGEVFECQKHESRIEHKNSLYRTFANMRALINTNVTDVKNVRFLTLTYKENMTDPKRLYRDFDTFRKRLHRYCKKQGFPGFEYISASEPQARGAWHMHIIVIFDSAAPFIPNAELARIWGHGFVKVTKIDDVDNIGAYLTAYLSDMELSECDDITARHGKVKDIIVSDDSGNMQKKRYVKGARLSLYPINFNIVRHSQGIRQPEPEIIPKSIADERTAGLALTFERTFKLIDSDSDFEIIINKRFFNKLRKLKDDS